MTGVVGREPELEQIAAFVRSVPDGPTALLIEGEGGAGKTTLWEEALARTVDVAQVLSCRPVQSEKALSYAALGDLVGGAIVDGLDDLPAPQRRALEVALRLEEGSDLSTDHRAVAAGARSLLVALSRGRPLLIAVDDLQWLDRSTTRVLGFAFRRLSTEPIGLLATVRNDRAASSSVPELDDLLRDHHVQRLHLGPLSVGAIERLLGEKLDLTMSRTSLVRLCETARGNPLLALELGRALTDTGSTIEPGRPLPVLGSLRALLAQRLRRLPADVREALLLASLVSHPAEDTLARAFGPGWDEAIGRGRQEGVVETGTGTVRFVHPLFASVVAGEASERERRASHRRLAIACEDGEGRARHSALAAKDPDEEVAASLEAAAQQATRRGAPDAAAELAELARALTPEGHPHDVYRRCTIAGEARFAAGDSMRALEHFAAADAVSVPGSERSGARWRLARVRSHHDDIAASRELLEQARREAGDDPALSAAIAHDLAYTCMAMGDLRAALGHATSAVELAEGAGTQQILAASLALVAVAGFLLAQGVRNDLLERARALEDWDEGRLVTVRPSVAVALVYSWVDRIDEARALLEESERQLLERGDDGSMPFLWYRHAEIDCWSGDWKRGYERAVDADRLAVQARQEGMRPMTCYAAALLAAHLGRTDEARAHADEGMRVAAATGHVLGVGLHHAVLGFLELSLGHPDRASALLGPLVKGARAGGFDEPGPAWWLPDGIEALVALGELSDASSLTDWLEDGARAIERPTGLAAAARCRALLRAAEGRTDEALTTCDEALAHHDRARIPFQRARTLFAKGQIARRARQWGVARASLDASLVAFEDLGAALWSERARDELARVGGRPPSPMDLTESEQQIAELVAAGRSNRDVAAALFLSPKTVSASLGRIYRKLGVTTRTEMAAQLRDELPTA
jgi:DNA-binding CsgD family transcriptional regulator